MKMRRMEGEVPAHAPATAACCPVNLYHGIRYSAFRYQHLILPGQLRVIGLDTLIKVCKATLVNHIPRRSAHGEKGWQFDC
jgi:hypothetical protein